MIAIVHGGGTGRLKVLQTLGAAPAPARMLAPGGLAASVAHRALRVAGLGAIPGATISFTTSSGNTSTPAVGDRWTISISYPAGRGLPVSVYGSTAPNGPRAETPYGALDQNGNWTSSGVFTADEIGTWYEDWKVGGQVVGNWTFTLVPAAAATAPAPVPTSAPASPYSPVVVVAPTGSGFSLSGLLSTPLGPFPLWVWAAGGIGAYAVFGGHRRGR
jgi:hypothetical protein